MSHSPFCYKIIPQKVPLANKSPWSELTWHLLELLSWNSPQQKLVILSWSAEGVSWEAAVRPAEWRGKAHASIDLRGWRSSPRSARLGSTRLGSGPPNIVHLTRTIPCAFIHELARHFWKQGGPISIARFSTGEPLGQFRRSHILLLNRCSSGAKRWKSEAQDSQCNLDLLHQAWCCLRFRRRMLSWRQLRFLGGKYSKTFW